MDNFLDDLNDSQREAVCFNDGPSLVVAGAGSGKTRVLTYKIAKLIEDGLRPSSILALTFTNKAAREMKERIGKLVGEENAKKLWMGTFHSIFGRILRKEADALGFNSDFTIYDSHDSHNVVKAIIKERKLDDKVYSPKKVASRISEMKNELVSPEAYAAKSAYHDYDVQQRMPLFNEIYRQYCQRCKDANSMDFDDLLMFTNVLFRDNPQILAKYQNIFKFILVDEYQDTNFSQFLIVKKLAQKNKRICVVGDDAQSIYSFRGARIENILNFEDTYKDDGVRVIRLEENYRSTPNIVAAANSLIQKNTKQIKKNVFSSKEQGAPVAVLSSYSDFEESTKIAGIIKNILAKDKSLTYADFAILYRTNAQSLTFEKTFRTNNIPYRLWGSTSFYERGEIKNVLGYLRLIINPNDEEAFKRVVNYPTRGIGDTTIGKILDVAHEKRVSAWSVICDPVAMGLSVNAGIVVKLSGFRELIECFIAKKEELDAYELAEIVIHQSGVWADLQKDKSPEGMSHKQNVEELLNSLSASAVSHLESDGEPYMLGDFMAEVALMTSMDDDDSASNEKVTLMTVHAAKGLEFKNVFVVGVEENLFPSQMSSGTEDGVEEERRLFYVAITRAEKFCVLSYAKSRMRNGAPSISNPSRFIKDIDSSLLNFDLAPDYLSLYSRVNSKAQLDKNNHTLTSSYKVNPVRTQPRFNVRPLEVEGKTSGGLIGGIPQNKPRRLAPMPSALSSGPSGEGVDVKVGDKVVHPQFGHGQVVKIEGLGTSMPKVVVAFDAIGEKTLILKYAKIKVIR